MDKITQQITNIKKKLKDLQKKDIDFNTFGSEMHLYELNPTISEKEIVQFEKKYKVELPQDYRNFLMKVGNGGAGPAYGLLSLQEAYENNEWYTMENIDKPFPSEPYEEYSEQVNYNNGILMLNHLGCGTFSLLIVTGNFKGKVCTDLRSSDGGLHVINKTFLDWYEEWLNESLNEISNNEYIEYYNTANANSSYGNYKEAIKNYKKSIKCNPNHYKSYHNLGSCYVSLNKFDDAIESFKIACEKTPHPEKLNSLYCLGDVYYRKGNYSIALEYFKKIDTNILKNLVSQTIMGDFFTKMMCSHIKLRNMNEATKYYQILANDIPENSLGYWVKSNIGYFLLETKNYNEAEKWIDKALNEESTYRPAIRNKGILLLTMGNFPEALIYLQKVVDLNKEFKEENTLELHLGHYNVACAYAGLNNESLVKENLKLSLQILPERKKYAKNDIDLKQYYSKTWFIELTKE